MYAAKPLAIEHIEAKPGTGTPRIAGKGVRVDFVAHLVLTHKLDMDYICEQYDLTPGEVYAALSYYADHEEELERTAREAEERLDRMFAENPELDVKRLTMAKRSQA